MPQLHAERFGEPLAIHFKDRVSDVEPHAFPFVVSICHDFFVSERVQFHDTQRNSDRDDVPISDSLAVCVFVSVRDGVLYFNPIRVCLCIVDYFAKSDRVSLSFVLSFGYDFDDTFSVRLLFCELYGIFDNYTVPLVDAVAFTNTVAVFLTVDDAVAVRQPVPVSNDVSDAKLVGIAHGLAVRVCHSLFVA